MRPPPGQRSERVRAKPQRRSCPEQSGHLSSAPPRSACAWSSTKITAGSFSHPAHPADWSSGRKGRLCCILGPDRPNASNRTIGFKSARTARTGDHHAGDGMDSSRYGSRPGRPSSPTVTPGASTWPSRASPYTSTATNAIRDAATAVALTRWAQHRVRPRTQEPRPHQQGAQVDRQPDKPLVARGPPDELGERSLPQQGGGCERDTGQEQQDSTAALQPAG
jgi:hypothetical protein